MEAVDRVRLGVGRWTLAVFVVASTVECRSFEGAAGGAGARPDAAGASNAGSGSAPSSGGTTGGLKGHGGDPEGQSGSSQAAGVGGTDDLAGHAGQVEQGGTGARGSEGGAAGDDSSAAAGASAEVEDEIIQPGCFEPGYHAAVAFLPTSDVAIARAYNGVFFVVAPQPTADLVAIRWQMTQLPESAWDSWACFGVMPNPERVAAGRLNNGSPVALASSSDGRLWSRFGNPAWGPWLPMTSPPGKGPILDLDFVVVGDEPNRMYAARSGRLYGRPASSTDPYASFGAWRELGEDVSVVAACPVDERTDSVFVVTEQGELRVAAVAIDAMGSSEWTTLDAAEVEGANAAACVRNGEGKLQLFADDGAGSVWRSIEPFEEWELADEAPAGVRAMDAAEVPGGDPTLVVVDEFGRVFLWRNQAERWIQ